MSILPARQALRSCLRQVLAPIVAGTIAGLLGGCGGGGGSGSNGSSGVQNTTLNAQQGSGVSNISTADAYRFLEQASFGPTPESVASVKQLGYSTWIDQQLATGVSQSHAALLDAIDADAHRDAATPDVLTAAWWTTALTDPAQLRLRVAYALSQIMVVSTVNVDTTLTASYLDMLTQRATGRYRDLLEGVARHPAMGMYLSHLANQKEDPTVGRVPDENFAREVMQLFSIGLYELDDNGRPTLTQGQPTETFTAADVSGLAKVFTGWSWWRPDGSTAPWWRCFWLAPDCQDPRQPFTLMSAYDNEHSTSIKRFLGTTIAAQSQANAAASLQVALDRLASHHNTAPFISRQLIQKLVTSNPSDAYVQDVVQVWRNTDGNLGAVVKAILLHDEARHPSSLTGTLIVYGKVREPVLRLAHAVRALPHVSQTYAARQQAGQLPYVGGVDTNMGQYLLGQTPMRSASVFNFYRPGYAPPLSAVAQAGGVAPEMQLSNEATVLAYANYMAQAMQHGWGIWLNAQQGYDVQFDWSGFASAEADDGMLADAAGLRLLGHALDTSLRNKIVQALGQMPRGTSDQRQSRIQAAMLMVLVSNDFIVQQ